jgi:DNA repair protein REV1
VIFHVDFDCFFVSCGLATRPHLRGKPSVVCHSQTGKNASTSEIASASYEARAKGVKNGMSLGRARQLVGDTLQTIPYVSSPLFLVYALMVDTNSIRTRNSRFHSTPF